MTQIRVDIAQLAGKRAMRKRAKTLRPSLARASRRDRRRVTGYAVKLLRTGWGPFGNAVWSTCEDVTLRIGGPRSGRRDRHCRRNIAG